MCVTMEEINDALVFSTSVGVVGFIGYVLLRRLFGEHTQDTEENEEEGEDLTDLSKKPYFEHGVAGPSRTGHED